MINAIKRQAVIQKGMYLSCWGTTVFMGVVGVLLMQLILNFDNDVKKYLTAGGGMAVIGLALWIIVVTLQFQYDFNMAITMGNTRSQFIIAYFVILFAENMIGILIAGIICGLEQSIYPLIYPMFEEKENLLLLPYIIKYGVPGAILFTALGGFFGTLILRFGKRAAWSLWVIWMCITLGLPRAFDLAEEAPASLLGMIGKGLRRIISSGTKVGVMTAVAVITLLCMVFTVKILKKQQVTV